MFDDLFDMDVEEERGVVGDMPYADEAESDLTLADVLRELGAYAGVFDSKGESVVAGEVEAAANLQDDGLTVDGIRLGFEPEFGM